MDRRAFLAGVGTALVAGCTSGDGTPDGTPTDTPTADHPDPSTLSGDHPVVDFETAPLTATTPGGRFRTDDRILPEQLVRGVFRPLQNTVPLFEPDVETVRLQTDRTTALRPLDDGGVLRFEYEGEAFEAVGETADG